MSSTFTFRGGRRLHVLLATGALFLILMSGLWWFARAEFGRLALANSWNLHTYRVLVPVAALESSLDKQESALRDFTLSGDAHFAGEARNARARSLRLLDELEQLTRDRAAQQQRLKKFESDFRAWNLRFAAPTLSQGQPLKPKLQRAFARDAQAREGATEALREQLKGFGAVEHTLLLQRERDQNLISRRANGLLLLGGALSVGLASAMFGLLWRGAHVQEDVSGELRLANMRLLQEIKARAQTQERLHESEESYRHLAEDSLDLICAYGRDGLFSYVSPASLPLLGFQPIELVGLSPHRMFHADDFPRDSSLLSWLDSGPGNARTVRARRKDGSWVWLELVGHAIVHPESGEVTQFHTTARDISARVREEERRQEMLDGLHATVRVADRLIEARSPDALLRLATELAHLELGCHDCQIWIADESGKTLRGAFALTSRGAIDPIAHLQLSVPPELRDRATQSGQRWNAVSLRPSTPAPGSGASPLTTAFPLVAGERLLGAMFVGQEFSGEPGSVRAELGRVFASLLSTLLERARSEDRSRQNQSLLATVVDNAPIIIYATDTEGRFTFSMGRALESLGFDRHTLIGRTIADIAGEQSLAAHGIKSALKGRIVDGPSRFNGQEFDAFRRPLLNEEGSIVGMVGVLVNVTDRASAQHALAQSEARYRGVVNSVTEVIFQTDNDARWTFLNAAWSEIMDYSVEESLGRSCDDFVHPDDLEAVRAHAYKVATDFNASRRMTARYQTRNGDVRWMEVFVRPLLNDGGDCEGFAGTLADITERFLAERALRQTTELQRAILGSASYAIFSCDARGVIQSFNRAAEDMLLLPASAVCGSVRAPLLIAAEDLRARCELLSRELNREIVPWEALTLPALQKGRDEREWSGIRSDGSRFPMRLSISPLRGDDREVVGFVAIGYDLSESRRIEKLKSEFVSVVSHELRTPLTSIRGALGLLGGGVAGALPDRAKQMIDIAHKNAERLVLLINDILDIEKIENGQMKFEMAPFDISALVKSALQSNAPYAQNLGVSLQADTGDEPLLVEGDESRLAQVMANLLSNAAKFTPQGGLVRVQSRRISATEALNAGVIGEPGANAGWVQVDVFDGGEGVAREFEDRLFTRFAQADSSATRAKGGTGLGLAISRAIVEKTGGVLRYSPTNPETGEPHSFNFVLPLHLAQKSASPTLLPGETPRRRATDKPIEVNALSQEQRRANDDATSTSFQGAPALNAETVSAKPRERVLVCEDDPDVAAFLNATLSGQGFDVSLAPDLASARAALRSESFDAMTLDLMLSDGDGIVFLDELRRDGFNLPVVVVSAHSEEGRVRGSALDVVDWLQKPVDTQRLQDALSRLQPHEKAGARARILHVEDDADIRSVTRAVLGTGVEVREAGSLAEARQLLQTETFDLALLDIGLPDGDGMDLLPLLAQMSPPVPVALFSAQEPGGLAGRQVAAALVKSRSNNAVLRSTIERLLRREPGAKE